MSAALMKLKLFRLSEFPLENKTVFLRVDYNVPLSQGRIADPAKIKASLPTIRYLLEKKCKIILATHLGRPEGRAVRELKTDILAKELSRQLKIKVVKLDDCIGKEIKQKIEQSQSRIFLLENLRFYRQEEEDDPFFAHALAALAEVYVNDAFAVCHRRHASVHAITRFLPALPGRSLEKEIFYLGKALEPARPAVWLIGGAKLDKIKFLRQALQKADYLLIGGALSFPFLRARGIKVGMSKADFGSIKAAKKLLRKSISRKIILPRDFVVVDHLSPRAEGKVAKYNQIQPMQTALDLGPETVELFKHYLRKARTIVWNGPLGYFEWARFAASTKEIGRLLGKLTATSIAGGGETAEAMHKFHLEYNLSHLSAGGGASLAFLSGEKLPALEALEKNYRKFRRKYLKK